MHRLLVFIYVLYESNFSYSFHLPLLKRAITAIYERGLLLNVDVKTADFFTSELDMNKSVTLLKDVNHIYNVGLNNAVQNAVKFDENLQSIVQRANSFIESNQLWNRDKLISALERIIKTKGGKFSCVLGGKNTGKSLVLKEMEKRFQDKVLLINLRGKSDILSGVIEELRVRKLRYRPNQSNDAIVTVIGRVLYGAVAGKLKDIVSLSDYQTFFDAIMKRPDALASVLDDIASGYGGITLIIDEANIALTIKEHTTPAEIKATREALAVFTKLTKEQRQASHFSNAIFCTVFFKNFIYFFRVVRFQLNVILVSSEHAFPFKLLDQKLDFSIDNFNSFIFVGEISPKDMYQLLTSGWGVEDTLAVTLIDHYGGHIWDIYLALVRLYEEKKNFWVLDSSMSDKVIKCLKWKGDKEGDYEMMREVLQRLAVTGFCPIEDSDDPIAKVISANNVGGVVKRSSTIIGLASEVWDSTDCENGIVPSKQSMRLAIAKQLSKYASNK